MLSKEELERLKDFILFAKENNISHVNLNGIEFKFAHVFNFPAEPDNTATPIQKAPSIENKLGLSPDEEELLYAASR